MLDVGCFYYACLDVVWTVCVCPCVGHASEPRKKMGGGEGKEGEGKEGEGQTYLSPRNHVSSIRTSIPAQNQLLASQFEYALRCLTCVCCPLVQRWTWVQFTEANPTQPMLMARPNLM